MHLGSLWRQVQGLGCEGVDKEVANSDALALLGLLSKLLRRNRRSFASRLPPAGLLFCWAWWHWAGRHLPRCSTCMPRTKLHSQPVSDLGRTCRPVLTSAHDASKSGCQGDSRGTMGLLEIHHLCPGMPLATHARQRGHLGILLD